MNMLQNKRKLLDADTSIWEVVQHSVVNFLYGFLSGLVIGATVIGSTTLIFISYVALKQVESKVLNRNKYTTRLGKNIIFPLPSAIGYLIGCYISKIITQKFGN